MADAPKATWWTSNHLDLTAKVVCETCNNGWMSDIENDHAKPALTPLILSDSEQILTAQKIASIAVFMFKHAVIGHFMDRSSNRYRSLFSPTTLHRFARTLAIPDGVQVWIACSRSESRPGSLRMRYKKTPIGAVNGFHLYIFTYSIGFFCVQMTIGRWTNGRNRKLLPFGLIPDPAWDDYSVPLWPTDDAPIHWPPRFHLSDQFLEAFSDRWKRGALPAIPLHRLQ